MEYYSAIKKNSFESVLMRWMKLEPIIQSEVSQKDKDHYSILVGDFMCLENQYFTGKLTIGCKTLAFEILDVSGNLL